MYQVNIKISINDQFIREVFADLIHNLGFEPNVFAIFETPLSGYKKKKYNQDLLLQLFKQNILPYHIILSREVNKFRGYDEEVIIVINDYLNDDLSKEYIKSCSISIRINDYQKILNNPVVNKILESEFLILSFIYNYKDVTQQSKDFVYKLESLDFPINKFAPNSSGGYDIDISENWGRMEIFRPRMMLVAAPMIWFGKSFKPVCPWETLLNYKYAHPYVNYIKYELFDIEDDPKNHRELQKEFWDFMESSGVKKITELKPDDKLSTTEDMLDMEQRHIRYMKSKDRVKITKK
jgi:hypothetical protein